MSGQPAGPTPPTVDLATVRAMKVLRDNLAKSDKGKILPTVANLIAILRHDPSLENMLLYNDFSFDLLIGHPPPLPDDQAPSLPGPYPRNWTSADTSLIHAYVQRVWTPAAKQDGIKSAMGAVAMMRSIHPVREWLDTLRWDGKPRLDTWLVSAFGAADTPYHAEVGAKFLIAAVRRVRHPGCKFDFMPVFEGAQGIGKSTALAALFGEQWFSDSIPHDLNNKDAPMALLGVWCLEMAEIEQLIRGEIETIKAFLSRQTDKYRPPYGAGVVSRPRHGVLAGTTNATEYLRDSTGNRRFWPIPCEFADPEWLRSNRAQIWAEAAAREASNEVIWLANDETQADAREHQSRRMLEDVWQVRIEEYIASRPPSLPNLPTSITVPDILSGPLQIPTKDQDKRSQMRVASILRQLRWERRLQRDGDTVGRKWFPPEP